MRAETSLPPPAANGTIIVTGRVGYVCALAIRETAGSAAAAAARCRKFRRGSFISTLPSLFSLFDHLVGGDEQLVRHGEAEHLGGRGVDDELELCCPHYRQICGLRALEDAAGIAATLAIGIGQASSIAHQPAGFREWAEPIDHGDP